MPRFFIDPDIRQARTLPAAFYRDARVWDALQEEVLARSWHYLADASIIQETGAVYPVNLLPGVLDEPLLLSRARDQQAYCLSNVCTHRGNVLVEEPGQMRLLRCGYHGRCFQLDGTFRSMPAFEEVRDFPGPEDHLPRLPLQETMGLLFTSIDPRVEWHEMIRPVLERVDFLPLDQLAFDPYSSADFTVNAHWALYVDNYLEGLHIPFVHPALNAAIDFDAYRYELFPYANLQIGVAREGEPCFDLPENHPDTGQSIYAYYFWVFPNLMFNIYPWGLSFNIVEPQTPEQTRVRFRAYRFPDASSDPADNALEQTELEDERVVENVQRGLQSRLYQSGRFSVKMEPNVHHFHRLLADWVGK